MSQEDLETRITNIEKTNMAILSLLRKVMDPEGKIQLNMTIEEMTVQLVGKNSITYDVSTNTVEGKILLCAIKDLQKAPFSNATMSRALDDRGWHTADSTLSVTLSRMLPKGLLIKDNGAYRLPSKVTYSGEALQ